MRPDLITFAKGVNSGYVPLGGVIISDALAKKFAHVPYPGGLTYSGHPLVTAAAVAALKAMADERTIENAARLGDEILGPGLRHLAEDHPGIGDVRGNGAFWAVELVADRATREPLSVEGTSTVMAACKELGLLLFTTANRLHLVPPCNLSDDDAAAGLTILDKALAVSDRLIRS